MKKVILLIVNILAFTGVISAQGVVFETLKWDFGTIEEEGGVVTCRFNYRNDDEKPAVIHDIMTSCGCTTPEYSRKPLMKGESAYIEITFDPMYRPGKFIKDIYVYVSSEQQPIELQIVGFVNERTLSVEERLPFVLGSGVRISTLYPTVRGCIDGLTTMMTLEYMNTSAESVEIEFVPRRSDTPLLMNYNSRVAPNGMVTMSVGYNYDSSVMGIEQLRDTVDIYINREPVNKVLCITGRTTR